VNRDEPLVKMWFTDGWCKSLSLSIP